MRKRQWGLLTGLLVALTFLGWRPLIGYADYTINHYDMQVEVQKDGSAQVTQAMTYDFDDDYHGVFNVQDLRGIQGATFEQVTTKLNNGPTIAAKATQSGQSNTYQLTQTPKQLRVKLYRTVQDDDQLRVTYRYRLLGVVTNYADTAELNWKIIGTGWDEPLKDVRLTIQLPATQVTTLQAWTHGPLAGKTKVDKKAGRVIMTLPRNPANSFVESHLLFPTSVTATNRRTSPKKRKAAVQRQEAALAKAANQKRQRQAWVFKAIYSAAVVLFGLTLLGIWWWLRRHPANQHQRPIPINHAFDVPAVKPAVAQALWRTASPDTQALSAEILQAAADHELELTVTPAKRQPDVTLVQLKPLSNSFLAHCFKKVTATDTLTIKALKAFGERDEKGRLNSWFSAWQQAIDEQVAVYQDATNFSIRNHWVGFSVVIFILSILVTLSGLLISPKTAMVTGLVTVAVTLGFASLAVINYRHLTINTDEGLALVNQINGFQRMLKDIGHFNTAEIGDLILWEQILPYAAAFGLAQQVTAKLKVDFGTAALATGLGIYYPIFFIGDNVNVDLSGIIGSGVSSALDAASNVSSVSGGSGGFSGGSSGGFGGGSGGGAF